MTSFQDSLARRRLRGRLALVAAAIIVCGCASHSQSLVRVREALVVGEPARALTEFKEDKGDGDDLLYLLELGYLEQAAGNYDTSNVAFEAAEVRAEELYTKSISGELAAMVTSDNIHPYRGYPYEMAMIQYYRAFNYLALDQHEDALVEARKANQKLVELADEKEGHNSYKNDAFLQYFTGLLYESVGEVNDAAVAYRNAYKAYQDYAVMYGVGPPPDLKADLYRSLIELGADEEAAQLAENDSLLEARALDGRDANVVLFVETGFTPYLEPVDIVLPIFEEKEDKKYRNCKGCELEYAGVLVSRYGSNIYAYSGRGLTLDHVLRFSFPRMVDYPSPVAGIDMVDSMGVVAPLTLAEPLEEISHREFDDRMPGILLKTIGRALVKEFVRTRVKKKDETLGALVNIANVATEQADTRAWLFLPAQISMVKLTLPAGSNELEVVFSDNYGAEIDRRMITADVATGETVFRRLRVYR